MLQLMEEPAAPASAEGSGSSSARTLDATKFGISTRDLQAMLVAFLRKNGANALIQLRLKFESFAAESRLSGWVRSDFLHLFENALEEVNCPRRNRSRFVTRALAAARRAASAGAAASLFENRVSSWLSEQVRSHEH